MNILKRWFNWVVVFVVVCSPLQPAHAVDSDTNGTLPDPLYQSVGDHSRSYFFTEAGIHYPYRVYVPKNWSPERHWPMVVILHGADSNQDAPFDRTPEGMAGILQSQAEQRGWIILSPYGYHWQSCLQLRLRYCASATPSMA